MLERQSILVAPPHRPFKPIQQLRLPQNILAEFDENRLQELEAKAVVSRPFSAGEVKQRKILMPDPGIRLLFEYLFDAKSQLYGGRQIPGDLYEFFCMCTMPPDAINKASRHG